VPCNFDLRANKIIMFLLNFSTFYVIDFIDDFSVNFPLNQSSYQNAHLAYLKVRKSTQEVEHSVPISLFDLEFDLELDSLCPTPSWGGYSMGQEMGCITTEPVTSKQEMVCCG